MLVHGFPDTPHTWRHLGPQLAEPVIASVAPWLPGYAAGLAAVSVGTYVRHILDVRAAYRGDERSVLIGHDWGANAGYGVVSFAPVGVFGRSCRWRFRRPPRSAPGCSVTRN